MIESKSVLITGGAGFIGSHLAENMLADGYRVVVLDDLSTGSLRNIQHLIDAPGLKFQLG
jgi:nucleoside-diphosphate-sugar epimerase